MYYLCTLLFMIIQWRIHTNIHIFIHVIQSLFFSLVFLCMLVRILSSKVYFLCFFLAYFIIELKLLFLHIHGFKFHAHIVSSNLGTCSAQHCCTRTYKRAQQNFNPKSDTLHVWNSTLLCCIINTYTFFCHVMYSCTS